MNLWRQLVRELDARRPVALVTVVSAAPRACPLAPGDKVLVSREGLLAHRVASAAGLEEWFGLLVEEGRAALDRGRPGTVDVGRGGVRVRVYIEPYVPPPVLAVVGAGHIAQSLAAMAKLVGMDVWVLDDRREYANRERFPTADRVLCAPFLEGLEAWDLGPGHYVVLVTRGHRHDMRCLRYVLDKPVAYIGMIGSRTRVQTVFRLLQEEHGVHPHQLDKVYAPIGLDIGARTPPEIALSVLAEVVKVRRGGSGESLSRLDRALIHDPRVGEGATR